MTKYFLSLKTFADYFKGLSDDGRHEWMANFFFKGYTAPLIPTPPEQSHSSVMEQLYKLSDINTQIMIHSTIKKVYIAVPGADLVSSGFMELLKSIALLNVADLFPDLYSLAFDGVFMNKRCEGIPKFLDLHTYLLKTLFGLTHERNEHRSIVKLAQRDIVDSRYMLECFNFVMHSPGHFQTCVKYVPLLLGQIPSKDRAYGDSVVKYLQCMGDDEIIVCITKIAVLLHEEEHSLLTNFQQILHKLGIDFSQEVSEDQAMPLEINRGEFNRTISKRDSPTLLPIYFEQKNARMLEFVLKVRNGSGEQQFLKYLEELSH